MKSAVEKHRNDFASKYAGLVQEDGTIKSKFATVGTGRLSSVSPNLQQVPKRSHIQKKEGMRIRNIFRAPPGEKFVIADFSQVELLLAATIAARETGQRGHMLEVFRKGEIDIHTTTAATVLGKSASQVTESERTLAKATNFSLIYGAQPSTLLEYARNNYGILEEAMDLEDAAEYRRTFFERYPELAAWHKRVEDKCKLGVAVSETPLGRRRKLPRWVERNGSKGKVAHTAAKNSPVQGAGADAIKLTMARLFEDRDSCPGNPRLRCSVHDEVVLSVASEHAEAAKAWVERHMAAAEREAVGDPESPIAVEVEINDHW